VGLDAPVLTPAAEVHHAPPTRCPLTARTRTAESPEVSLEARQVAVSCTPSRLMARDREQRLAWLMDSVFDLSSTQAAQVLEIGAEAYRQRLSRARARLDPFMQARCGLVSEAARCRCESQATVLKSLAAASPTRSGRPRAALALRPVELEEAERTFRAYARVADAAAVFRSVPELAAPDSMQAALRAVLVQEGFMDPRPPH
jgi:hypothetical protein